MMARYTRVKNAHYAGYDQCDGCKRPYASKRDADWRSFSYTSNPNGQRYRSIGQAAVCSDACETVVKGNVERWEAEERAIYDDCRHQWSTRFPARGKPYIYCTSCNYLPRPNDAGRVYEEQIARRDRAILSGGEG